MSEKRIALADSGEISRLSDNLPWEILRSLVTIQAHCVCIMDQEPNDAVKDLVGCISQNVRDLAFDLSKPTQG